MFPHRIVAWLVKFHKPQTWDGNGAFSRTKDWTDDRDAAIKILASRHDENDDELTVGIGACLTKNNESKPTADFKPNADNAYSFGSSALRWINIFLTAIKFQQASFAGTLGATTLTGARTYTLPDASGTVLLTGAAINETHGADIASATTTNLETATGNVVDVTGTTTITAITLSEGHERVVRFTGILTLTHGASLVLPNAANILTAAGDYAVFRGYAAGVVRLQAYQKLNGRPIIADTPTRQVFTSGSGTYTTPAGCKTINVRLTGGGGGAGGSGSGSPGAGVAGGDTTFSTLTGSGGVGGSGSTGGAGGTGTNGDVNLTGGAGGGAAAASTNQIGGIGGCGFFGGFGAGGQVSAAGGIGVTNTGGGGGGGGCGATPPAGAGGGAGGFCEKRINAPAGTYSYGVGAAGTGGAAGTSGAAGGAGGSGLVIVDEWY